MLTVDILICTIDDGIGRVPAVLLPPAEGVRYLVSWQLSDSVPRTVPEALGHRCDVSVHTLRGRGLSANRNHALSLAAADIVLIADDDVRYMPETIIRLRQAFTDYPEAGIITFQATDYNGYPLRTYPSSTYTYGHRPRGSYVCSWEIACRRLAPLPPFDQRFGIGAPYMTCGEEEVFVHRAAKMGCCVRYVPVPIVHTSDAGTGSTFLTAPGVQRAKGGVLCIMHGPIGAALRCMKYATSLPRSVHRLTVLRRMLWGIAYTFFTDSSH